MTTRDDDVLARVALTWLAEPGTWAVYRLVAQYGATAALESLLAGQAPDRGLRRTVAARLGVGDPLTVAARSVSHTARLGARIVVPDDPEWPLSVQDLARLALPGAQRRVDVETAPPLCFWVRGGHPLHEAFSRSVAVVGARAATPYGLHVATGLGYGLADREWTVVSGGALGIDAAAHRGALHAGGMTVAVLACGIDRPYPLGNTALFDQIAETGLLISEWLPGAEPLRPRFLIRNRVIAAATAGSVLVEAAARSGATQTLHRALALGRPSMVVPGAVTSAMSVGGHELLREHPQARLVTGLPHILEEVGRIGVDLAPLARGELRPHDHLDDEATLLVEALPGHGDVDLPTLAGRAGLDTATAHRKVALLEQLGMVVRHEGNRYALSPPASAGSTSDGSPPADSPQPDPRPAAAHQPPPRATAAATPASPRRERAHPGSASGNRQPDD